LPDQHQGTIAFSLLQLSAISAQDYLMFKLVTVEFAAANAPSASTFAPSGIEV